MGQGKRLWIDRPREVDRGRVRYGAGEPGRVRFRQLRIRGTDSQLLPNLDRATEIEEGPVLRLVILIEPCILTVGPKHERTPDRVGARLKTAVDMN